MSTATGTSFGTKVKIFFTLVFIVGGLTVAASGVNGSKIYGMIERNMTESTHITLSVVRDIGKNHVIITPKVDAQEYAPFLMEGKAWNETYRVQRGAPVSVTMTQTLDVEVLDCFIHQGDKQLAHQMLDHSGARTCFAVVP